jgi:hypothetical protein
LVMPVLRESSLRTLSCWTTNLELAKRTRASTNKAHEMNGYRRIKTSNAVVPSDESSICSEHLRERHSLALSTRDTVFETWESVSERQARKDQLGSPSNDLGSDPSIERVRHSECRKQPLREIGNEIRALALLCCWLLEREGETEGLANGEQRGVRVVLAVEDELARKVLLGVSCAERPIADRALDLEERVGGVAQSSDCKRELG